MKLSNVNKWGVALMGFVVMLMGATAFIGGNLMFLPLLIGGGITTAVMLQDLENEYKNK